MRNGRGMYTLTGNGDVRDRSAFASYPSGMLRRRWYDDFPGPDDGERGAHALQAVGKARWRGPAREKRG